MRSGILGPCRLPRRARPAWIAAVALSALSFPAWLMLLVWVVTIPLLAFPIGTLVVLVRHHGWFWEDAPRAG